MKIIPVIASLLISFIVVTEAKAEWSLKDINQTIDHTNWIVNDSCSGTTLDASRKLIITNHHCINGPPPSETQQNHLPGEMTVSRLTYDNFSVVKEVRYSAIVKASDPTIDIAVLEIRDKTAYLYGQIKFPPNSYQMIRGENVYIVGNPQMLDSSLVFGNISSVERSIPINGKFNRYFQISGGLAPGASGGAVYNNNGEFIGVPTTVNPKASYLGMAVPVSAIKTFLTRTGIFPKFD